MDAKMGIIRQSAAGHYAEIVCGRRKVWFQPERRTRSLQDNHAARQARANHPLKGIGTDVLQMRRVEGPEMKYIIDPNEFKRDQQDAANSETSGVPY